MPHAKGNVVETGVTRASIVFVRLDATYQPLGPLRGGRENARSQRSIAKAVSL